MAGFRRRRRRRRDDAVNDSNTLLAVVEGCRVHGLVIDILTAVLRLQMNGGTKAEMSLQVEVGIEEVGLENHTFDGRIEGRGHCDRNLWVRRHDSTDNIHVGEVKEVGGVRVDEIGGVERLLAESAGVVAGDD